MPSRPRHVWEPDDKKKTDRTDPHKTEEQRQVERLSSLANVSDGIRNAEKISAVKDRLRVRCM